MSLHKSLKSESYPNVRSVRTRRERVEKLIRNLKWMEKNQSVYALPKEIIKKLKKKIKDVKEIKDAEPLAPFTP